MATAAELLRAYREQADLDVEIRVHVRAKRVKQSDE